MSTWYWNDATNNQLWSDVGNWWTGPHGTGSNPAIAPWIENNSTKNDNLTMSDASTDYPLIDTTIGSGFSITGICDIPNILNFAMSIYGGTFTGSSFNTGGNIFGGTYTGSGMTISAGAIFDGLFSASGINNSGGSIYGGTFTGPSFYNSGGQTFGGLFSGDGFYNGAGIISNGLFIGNNFTNGYGGYIFGGTFKGTFDGYGDMNQYPPAITGGIFIDKALPSPYTLVKHTITMACPNGETLFHDIPQLDIIHQGI